MKLALPIFGTAINTLNRWSAILRQTDFVTNDKSQNLIDFDTKVASLATMTVTKNKQDLCGYSDKLFPWIYIDMRLQLTLGGVAESAFFVTLPVAPFSYPGIPASQTIGPSFTCTLVDGGVYRNGIAVVRSLASSLGANSVIIGKEGGANFTLGAVQLFVSGWYRRQT